MFSPTLRPAPSRIAARPLAEHVHDRQLGGASAASISASNIGLSATRLRMYQPITTSTADSRNGTRQPQAMKSASLWKSGHQREDSGRQQAARAERPPAASSPNSRAASHRHARPPSAPRRPIRRRPRSPGPRAARSARSAPTRRCWRSRAAARSAKSRAPIITRLHISNFLRPMRSPKWPNTIPPKRPRDEANRIGRECQQRAHERVEARGRTAC